MPGFASHYLFGQQSLSHLKEDQEYHILSLHPHAYNLGLQGPDIFYYYLPAWLLYDHNAASLIHENSSLQFFIAMIDARNKLSSHSERIIADAYICGFLGHYTLDTYCHPYIFDRTHHYRHSRTTHSDNSQGKCIVYRRPAYQITGKDTALQCVG